MKEISKFYAPMFQIEIKIANKKSANCKFWIFIKPNTFVITSALKNKQSHSMKTFKDVGKSVGQSILMNFGPVKTKTTVLLLTEIKTYRPHLIETFLKSG